MSEVTLRQGLSGLLIDSRRISDDDVRISTITTYQERVLIAAILRRGLGRARIQGRSCGKLFIWICGIATKCFESVAKWERIGWWGSNW